MEPLAGLRVGAPEQAVAAPLCSARFADAGAGDQDRARRRQLRARVRRRRPRRERLFVWLSHGQGSLVLDIKASADRDLLARIAARADVFIEDLAPGAGERAGFGAASLRAARPRAALADVCVREAFPAFPPARP